LNIVLSSKTVQSNQPLVVDLGMSDVEYLELLAKGEDPVKRFRDQAYEVELLGYGISAEQARRTAPLIEKQYCSIEEKICINQTLWHIWAWLISKRDVVSS
jgi:hypothetical protein